MPVLEALNGTGNVNGTLGYCEKEKNREGISKCTLKAGVNCDIHDIKSDFEETRNYFNKTGGRQGMHFSLSFSPEELPKTLDNQQKCLDIGVEVAEKIAKGHESGVFVHVDRSHLHCHIVVNSVSYETGKKYHMEQNKDLVIVRNSSDQICKKHGVGILEPYKGNKTAKKGVEMRIKQRGGVAWKDEIVEAVNYAKQNALSEKHYKELLAEKGVEMYQRGEKSFGYEHIGQREAGKSKYRLRDRNKALDGNHYEDVLKQIERNQEKQREALEPSLSRKKQDKKQKEEPKQKSKDISSNSTVAPSLSAILNDDKEKWRAKKDHEQLQKRIAWEQRKHER